MHVMPQGRTLAGTPFLMPAPNHPTGTGPTGPTATPPQPPTTVSPKDGAWSQRARQLRRNHRSRATSRAPVGPLGLPTRSTLTASGPWRTPLPRKPIRSGHCQLRCHDKLRSSHCQSSALTLKPPAAGGPMDWALISMGEEDAAQPPEPSYLTRSCGPLGLPTRPTRATAGLLRTPLPRKPIRSGHCPALQPR